MFQSPNPAKGRWNERSSCHGQACGGIVCNLDLQDIDRHNLNKDVDSTLIRQIKSHPHYNRTCTK